MFDYRQVEEDRRQKWLTDYKNWNVDFFKLSLNLHIRFIIQICYWKQLLVPFPHPCDRGSQMIDYHV